MYSLWFVVFRYGKAATANIYILADLNISYGTVSILQYDIRLVLVLVNANTWKIWDVCMTFDARIGTTPVLMCAIIP